MLNDPLKKVVKYDEGLGEVRKDTEINETCIKNSQKVNNILMKVKDSWLMN